MKFYLPFFVVIMMCTMLLSAVHSEEVAEPTLVIEMLNKRDKERMLYSDELVRVEVGDTISWVPTSKGHNVQFVSVPEGVEKVKSKLSKEFSYTFEQEGAYLYVCTPHASMGMIGVVIVGNTPSDINLDEVKKYKFRGKSKKKFKKILKSLEDV